MNINFKDVDEYIKGFPVETQKLLLQVRQTIKDAAPEAKEIISYGIPTFNLEGNLVHYAAYKHHIGFYPGAAAVALFKNELPDYKTSKGAIQFPVSKAMPLDLIRKITLFKLKQNLEKATLKVIKK